jgi:O-antigen/teichoic acid export membrane protein
MMVKELFPKIKVFLKTDYLKNIVGQAGIVFIAQLIPLVFSPLISRFYNENALAEVTGMVSLSSLFLVFSSFRLGQAIVIEKDDLKVRQLMVLTFFINTITSLFLFIILFLFKDFFVRSFKVDNVIYIVPIYIFSYSLFGTLDGWFIRQKKFKNKAIAKIIESSTYLIFAFSIYFIIGDNEYGLAFGKIIGIVLGVLFLVRLSKYKIPDFTIKDLTLLLHKYKEFPLHDMPSSFINVISLQILVLFLGFFYSKAEVGFFGLANMVVLTPISFVSQAVSSIFFQKIVEDVHQQNYRLVRSTFLKTFFLLSTIAVPGFLGLWFFSESLVPIIFGDNWVLTGKIAKALSLVFLIQMVVSPISSAILIPLGKIKLNAIWQYSRFFFMTIALLIMIYILKLNFLDFIKGYSYCVVISYAVYFFVIYRIVNIKANS